MLSNWIDSKNKVLLLVWAEEENGSFLIFEFRVCHVKLVLEVQRTRAG